ncbi:glycosyl hydrolase 53 family protein [Streptomyces sp. NPDC006617]|uniref:glycoside hydrolase family 53 protein n=1 Tax=Streptomyces sp. NPDC006617 TaxID=3155354 RepID=UPI0033BC4709
MAGARRKVGSRGPRLRIAALVLAVTGLLGSAAVAPAAAGAGGRHHPPVASDDFAAGGDLTMLNWVEDSGGEFSDANGTRRDPVGLLADNGFDLARLRVYTGTGPDHPRIGYPDSYLPEGYQDEEDMLKAARRVGTHGMDIQLTLHYSDYWSNGAIQDIPKDWRDATNLPNAKAVDELEKDVHDYTARVMRRLKSQGTTPAYVSLGNEMQGGLLFPYGRTDSAEGWSNLARFLTAGYQAVKEVSPSTKVILHLDDAGNMDKYEWFFSTAEANHIPYDVIGSSYYPFWTRKDIQTVKAFFDDLHRRFGKKIMVMETGFNWNPVTHDGVEGQLSDNGPVSYPETPQGQHDYLVDLFAALKSVEDHAVLGVLYWDPVMIPAPGVGWEVGEPNVVSNAALFDFNGRALPGLRAYRTA